MYSQNQGKNAEFGKNGKITENDRNAELDRRCGFISAKDFYNSSKPVKIAKNSKLSQKIESKKWGNKTPIFTGNAKNYKSFFSSEKVEDISENEPFNPLYNPGNSSDQNPSSPEK
jgi:hypothetical protein